MKLFKQILYKPVWRPIQRIDTNQVIAIIDTGVDKDHEDLKNKMWVNTAELNGSPGVDDDQNGFVDDISVGTSSITLNQWTTTAMVRTAGSAAAEVITKKE